MSVTVPTSSGAVANRNDSAFHGLIPYAFHARVTVLWLTFSSPASSLLDQCVTASFFGGGVSVAVTTAA